MKPLSVIVTNASQALQRPSIDQPADWLDNTPLENQRASIQLLKRCGLSPKFERAGGSLTPKSVSLNPSEATDWQLCGEIISELMAPAPEEKILEWLATMSVVVAKKGEDEKVSRLEMITYTRKLRSWPADVVHRVLDRYPDQHKWWPDWYDLRPLLAEEARERMMLSEAFNRWVSAPEHMARREGLAAPDGATKRLPAPVPDVQRIVTPSRDRSEEPSHEERERLMRAHKARLRAAEDKSNQQGD